MCSTVDFSLKNFLQVPAMAAPIRGYLGPCYSDGEFFANVENLEAEVAQNRRQGTSLPPHLYLRGEFGLTGICMAYSIACTGWVQKYAHCTPLPPLLPNGRPSEAIRHVQKLLVEAVFQTIPKRRSPDTIIRSAENASLIDTIFHRYLALQMPLTGVDCARIYPGPTLAESSSMSRQIETIFKEPPGSYLLIMNQKGAHICAWHVIYINTHLGIIADAASNLLWRASAVGQRHFLEMVQRFCAERGYDDQEVTALQVHLSPSASSCKTPLLLSRLQHRTYTTALVTHKLGLRQGMGYLYAIHQHQPIVATCTRLFKRIQQARTPQVPSIFPILDAFQLYKDAPDDLLLFLKNNKKLVSHFQDVHVLLNTVRYRWVLDIESMLYDDHPEYADRVLRFLKNVRSLGESYHALSAALQHQLLEDVITSCKDWGWGWQNYDYYPHVLGMLIPEILELRSKTPKRLSIDYLINVIRPESPQIPLYKLLIRFGASPNGDVSHSTSDGMTPLQKLLEKQKKLHENVSSAELASIRAGGYRDIYCVMIDFFRQQGARE